METQTTTAAQTTQQEQLSALERARANDTRTGFTLKAEQAYDELEAFGDEPGTYGENSAVQGEYWRFKFKGSIVTVSPEFKKAYDDGTLLSITATPTVYEQMRPDPNNAAALKPVVGYGWALSFSDLSKKQKALNATKQAGDIELSMKINEIKTQKKAEALAAMDLSKFITEDDMKILMEAM